MSKEGVGSHGARVIGRCELPDVGAELELGSSAGAESTFKL